MSPVSCLVPRLLPCLPPVLQRQSLGSGPHSASHPPRILSAPIGPASCPHDPPHSLVTFQMSKPQLIFFLIPWQRLALFTPDCFFPLTFVEITLQSEVGGLCTEAAAEAEGHPRGPRAGKRAVGMEKGEGVAASAMGHRGEEGLKGTARLWH